MEKIKRGYVFYCSVCDRLQSWHDCKEDGPDIICSNSSHDRKIISSEDIGYPETLCKSFNKRISSLKTIQEKSGKDKSQEITKLYQLVKDCERFEDDYKNIKRINN